MEFVFLIALIIVIIIIIAIIVAVNNSNYSSSDTYISFFEEPQRKAGKRGEEKATEAIRSILHKDDCLFTNVKFCYDNRFAELDCVVVNKYGVFVIEVKNYVGEIYGGEDDFEWKKYKKTDTGNIYEKNVKNPIRQVKRQVYLLSKHLKYYGVDVWVKGYALLLNQNSPVQSEFILSSVEDIDGAIHKRDRNLLSNNTIEHIKEILS